MKPERLSTRVVPAPLAALLLVALALVGANCAAKKPVERMDYPLPREAQRPQPVPTDAPTPRLEPTRTTPLQGGERKEEPTIRRADLLAIWKRGAQHFSSQVLTRPYLRGNRFVGFQILALFPNDKRFRNARIKPGDVVMRVNGFRIERPKQFMTAWAALEKAKQLDFEILRDDKPLRVVYRIVEK